MYNKYIHIYIKVSFFFFFILFCCCVCVCGELCISIFFCFFVNTEFIKDNI